ncbi:MAG: polyisoprenoid-binding protein [Balneolaceae bacterium]|nr:MAG: polyisoprenoid-binding protein [Balneolaceae bacterium]
MKLLSIIPLLLLSFTLIAAGNLNNNNKSDTNEAPTWSIDRAHSAVQFKVRHFFTPVPGSFDQFEGVIKFDPANLEGSSIDVNIAVSSINTNNSDRDEHLRSDDFFAIERFPEMHFKSSSIRETGENSYVAEGMLTIRDVSREIELPFEFLGSMEHPMRENTTVAGFKAGYKLMRTDFGVGSGSWAMTAVVGDEIDIEILMEVLHRPS